VVHHARIGVTILAIMGLTFPHESSE